MASSRLQLPPEPHWGSSDAMDICETGIAHSSHLDFIKTKILSKMTGQEEIQRLRTRIAELESEKQIADELWRPEEQYQILFNTLIERFCIIEAIFDADARPVDFRLLEVNPAFELQTGLKNARGRLVRELIPDLEAHWFEIYGQVALTGQPARFVNEAKPLNLTGSSGFSIRPIPGSILDHGRSAGEAFRSPPLP
jgi:PAS domain-containing protein